MLRSAIARHGVCRKLQAEAFAAGSRTFCFSAALSAAAPAGKKKVKLGFKPKEAKEKVRKGGMTHLNFRDAVSRLKFENLAQDTSSLNLNSLKYESLKSIHSTVVRYEDAVEKQLREIGSFKKLQHHELLRNPVSMVTENTIKLNDVFTNKLDNSSLNNRLCLIGEKGVGKSTAITQVQALAVSKFNKDVVLLHIDHPERIVEGSSDYIFNRKMGKYQQPMFTKRWIKKLRAANEEVFKKMPLTRDINFTAKKVEHKLKKGENTVYDFILLNHDFGLVGPSEAFQFLIQELKAHSEKFPVLVSIDNFNALIAEPYTKYFHPNMVPIHFTQFEVGHFIRQLVCGEFSFAKGGLLLAESKDLGECKTLRVGLGLEEHDPYDKMKQCDTKFAESLLSNGGVQPFALTNLSKEQTRNLLLFWDQCGALQIRDYACKESLKPFDAALQEKPTVKVGEFVDSVDPTAQLENLVQTTYFLSSGNPGSLLKANHLVF